MKIRVSKESGLENKLLFQQKIRVGIEFEVRK